MAHLVGSALLPDRAENAIKSYVERRARDDCVGAADKKRTSQVTQAKATRGKSAAIN
jgi:hypothetical protein